MFRFTKKIEALEKRIAALEEKVQEPQKEIELQIEGEKIARIVTPTINASFVETLSEAVGKAVMNSMSVDNKNSLHALEIKGGVIKLDGFKLKGVTGYELKHDATKPPKLILEVLVNNEIVTIDENGWVKRTK